MDAPPLTLVVPLRLQPAGRRERGGARNAAVLARLDRLLRDRAGAGAAALVADDTADPALGAEVAALVARHPRARRLAVTETASRPFSIGRLRDLGAEAAAEGFVLFHDVDFAAPPPFWAALRGWLAAGALGPAEAFACVPVWFLTRAGALAWRAAPGLAWRALAREAAAGRGPAAAALADRLARGSSAMLLRRARLLDLGGHSPRFEGHGAEDFELLHRLAEGWPTVPRPPDYWRDFGSRDRGERGFRARFARYADAPAAAGLAMAHLWHPPRRADPRYYARRRENFAALEAELRRAVEGEGPPGVSP